MKVCPECKYQFGDAHEFCPTHGKRLTAVTVYMAPGASAPGSATVFFNPHAQQPQENYDRFIGTVLDGRYMLLEKMGEGGMGVVFKAKHTVIEKQVAVKILKREVARDRAVLQRFVQEAKAASRIGHPSIVDVTDFGTLPDGSAYQVMEFIGGVTLGQAIKAGPMWAARALPIIGQMARALGAAHEKGIVHRDLKPDNIFLVEKNGRQDMVKIVDFGVAKFAPTGMMDGPRLTRAGAVFGTPEYMAPEQAAGRSDNDHRVDVYALGTILYEMLVGRVPHKGETIVATLAQQMLDPIIPPRRMNPRADVSDRVEQVIMTAVAKDRDRRYQSMTDFWVGLEWAAVEQGIVLDVGGTMSVDMPMATPPGLTSFDAGRGSGNHPQTPAWMTGYARQGMGGPTVPDARESAVMEAMTSAAGARTTVRRLTFAAIGVISIAAATLGLAFALKKGKENDGIIAVPMGADAGAIVARAAFDAGLPSRPDAGVLAQLIVDAGPPQPDAESMFVRAGSMPDAASAATPTETTGTEPPSTPTTPTTTTAANETGETPVRTSGSETLIERGPTHEIVVATKPGGGSLYIAGLAAGTDGTTFRRSKGTRLEVRCLFPGNDRWEPGKLSLVFDGRTSQAKCELTRRTRCVKDLHNPFRHCPD